MNDTRTPPFRVGQIIFLIPKGERRVIPAQVTEEILRRTISGEETVWMIHLAGSSKSVPFDPDVAEYFVDAESLRNEMVQRTVKQVNLMIDKTIALASETFEIQQPKPAAVEDLDVVASVVLPDGTRAKLRTA
jgi:hypothetical protein